MGVNTGQYKDTMINWMRLVNFIIAWIKHIFD